MFACPFPVFSALFSIIIGEEGKTVDDDDECDEKVACSSWKFTDAVCDEDVCEWGDEDEVA